MLAIVSCLVIFSTGCCVASLSGDLTIVPFNELSAPGGNVSFLCQSSKSVHSFTWKIENDQGTNTHLGIKENDTSSRLILSNVGIATKLRGYNHITCTTDSGEHTGTVLYIGYPPLSPTLECVMQNLDVLHCRWYNCDPRLKDHLEWRQSNTFNVTFRNTPYYVSGVCHSSEILEPFSCSSSCSSTEYANRWRYWRKMKISVDVSSEMGKNSNEISFSPIMNVVLSPPSLKIVNLRSNNDGVSINVAATYRSHVSAPGYFNYCKQDGLNFEIQYKEVSSNFSLGAIKTYTEEDFWRDWSQRNATMAKEEADLMADSKTVTNTRKEITISFLPGNSLILIEARWKLSGSGCNGYWSTGSYITHRTSTLIPPLFYQTALFFFKENTVILPSVFSGGNVTYSSIMIWSHTEQSYFIHKNVSFKYQITSDSERCAASNAIAPKSLNFIRLNIKHTQNGCRLKVNARNNLGQISSPSVSPASNEGDCVVRILSVRLVSLLKFRVRWVYFSQNQSSHCDEKALQEKLNVTLFVWAENRMQCKENMTERSVETLPPDAVTKSFVIKIRNVTANRETNNAIGFRAAPYNSSLGFSYPFRAHTGYKIAVSFSWNVIGAVIHQSPAKMSRDLFYNGVEVPTGIPLEVFCSDIGERSMTVNWRHLRPQERGGPLVGYEIYYTTHKKCFSGHNAKTCRVAYDASPSCNESFVTTIKYSLSKDESVDRNGALGWRVEVDDKCTLFSRRLTELKMGTNYYIGVAAYNKAGRSKCFRSIVQATRDITTKIILVACCFVTAICLFFLFLLLRSLRRRRSCLWRQMPRPVLNVPLFNSDDSSVQLVSSKSDDHGYLQDGYVSLTEDESLTSLFQPRGNPNSKNAEKVYRVSDQSLTVSSGSIGPYLIGIAPKQSKCDHQESSSLGSDIPSCSTPSACDESVLANSCDKMPILPTLRRKRKREFNVFSDEIVPYRKESRMDQFQYIATMLPEISDGVCYTVESDEDGDIYTSPETALIMSASTRQRVDATPAFD